jgi:TolB-like protein/DNA-binding SARP family transcriptional activator/Tfp pilus assembly protein PilF
LFSLKLFAGASILTPSGPLQGRAVHRHRLALVALLNQAGARGLTRDKLAGLLWPDAESSRARAQLSDSVYRVNQALGGEIVVATGEELRLNRDRLPSDVASFESALDRGDRAAAVALYDGPFLDGFSLRESEEFNQWVDGERERLRRLYASALETLAENAIENQQLSSARDHLHALAAHDPYSTRVALRLISVLGALGDQAAALRHARAHETLLRNELGVEPGKDWAAAIARVKAPLPAGLTVQPVEVQPLPSRPVPVAISPRSLDRFPAARARSRRGIAVIAGLVLLAALAVVGGYRRARAAAARSNSIAVMPFADLSQNHDQQYFADGLTEELGNTLSRVTRLNVAARTSAFALRNSAIDVREVGRKLGVTTILEGTVRQADGKLRISVELVDARSGYKRWSETYDRPAADVLSVQEEIARAIVNELKGGLAESEDAALASTPIDTLAFNLYLKGRYHWHRRSQRDLKLAIENFEASVRRSPAYARAWAGLADAYAICGFYDYLPPRTAFPRAQEAAERALQLDSRLAAANATLGYIELYYRWNFARAEEHFQHTILLDSAYSTGHQWYANLLTAAGRFPEAESEMRRAQLFDPLSLIASAALGWSIYFSRRYSEADQQLQQTIALDSTFQLAHLWRGWVLEEQKQLAAARKEVETGVRLSGGSSIYITALARIDALLGDRTRAQLLLDSLESGKHGYVPPYELAKVYLGLGDKERALDLLERAVAERAHSIAFVRVDPQLDVLRAHPRFLRLLTNLKSETPAPQK